MGFFSKILGTHSQRELKRIYPLVDKIEALSPVMEKLTDEEKYDALKKLMKHYHSEGFAFNTDMMKGTNVYRMTVLDLTGKRRGNGHPEEKQTHITME